MFRRKKCVVCGVDYIAQRSTSKTCSGSCRVALHRELRAGKEGFKKRRAIKTGRLLA